MRRLFALYRSFSSSTEHISQVRAANKEFGISQPQLVNTPEEAVQSIQSQSRIYVHSVASTPMSLLSALSKRSNELKQIELVHLHLEQADPCSTEANRHAFFTNNLFVGHNQRQMVAKGFSSYVPTFLSEMPKLLLEGPLQPDYALLNLSPPDKHGFCSLGPEIACAYPATKSAKVLIGQLNPQIPRTHGTAFVHYSDLDYVVEVNEPIPSVPPPAPTESEIKIGQIIAGLVQDGSVLQMGIGAIPNAVLSQLVHHKDLGIHTEMFTDGAVDLILKGVVTNQTKKFMPGRTLTSFVVGSQKLYDFVDDNPSIAFMDASITNDPRIIGRNDKVVAINSAVEVDITGQVCADSVGTYHVSGVGGQIDFERGAGISRGGLPIIALNSTTKHGESRIVSLLKPGAGVVTTRYHVHYVVTEYGHVNLFGLNLHQRAKALINIAHPKFREQLEKEAFERFRIKTWF